MALSLVAHYEVYSAASDQTTLTTPSFTPSNGEVLVVKLSTWNSGDGMAAPTGGGQTYTAAKTVAPGGFNGFCAVYVATVSGSPGSMAVSSAPATAVNTRHSMVVERWSGAKLAGTPAVNSTASGTGAPSANITTTGANSVVSWVEVDEGSADPATRTYRLSATEDGLFDGHVGSNSVQYFAYASVASASTVAMGMTAPSSQTWVLAGVEIQAATGTTVTGTAAATLGSLTATAAGTRTVLGTATATLGRLTATASGKRVVLGVATANLGRLVARASVVVAPVKADSTPTVGAAASSSATVTRR